MVNILEQYLIENWQAINGRGSLPGDLSLLKLGGQNSARGSLNFLVFTEDKKDPGYFLKMNRKPGHFLPIDKEFHNLNKLAGALGPRMTDTFPRPIFMGKVDDFTLILVESFLKCAKININKYCELSILSLLSFHWLRDFFVLTRKGETNFGVSELERSLGLLMPGSGISGDCIKKAEEILEIGRRYHGAYVPLCSAQGDFDFSNILINKNGIAVVDWEDYRELSHPFLDPEFFIFNAAAYFYPGQDHTAGFRRFFLQAPGQRH